MKRIENVVVVGGGIGGLCAALWLGDRGYQVTVLERDDISVPDSVEEAWGSWDRSGAPQVRFPHFVMARLCSLLRENQPEVYRALVGTGATEVPFTDFLTPESADYQPEPGDDELTAVRSRRTTVEWVLRKAALAHDRVRVPWSYGGGRADRRAGSRPARDRRAAGRRHPNRCRPHRRVRRQAVQVAELVLRDRRGGAAGGVQRIRRGLRLPVLPPAGGPRVRS